MGGHAFQARRALDLAALTARLKPCPSTTARIPAFFCSLWKPCLHPGTALASNFKGYGQECPRHTKSAVATQTL